MKHIITIAVLILSCFLGKANAQARSGHLSIVSEDNEPFYLYINGIKYNSQASLMVRVEDLNVPDINCRIEFVSRRAPVLVNSLAIADEQGYMQDITYALSSSRRGANALVVYQVIPMEPIQVNQNAAQTFRYGNPRVGYQPNYQGGFRPGGTTGGPRGGRGGGRPGGHDGPGGHGGPGGHEVIPSCPMVSPTELNAIRSQANGIAMDKEKLTFLQMMTKERCFTTDQVVMLSQLFSFSANKLSFFKEAYRTVLDPQLYYTTLKELSFSSERNELSNFMNQNKR
ncbi:MAG: DUF4476 domain-containing protein [Sphingobacteriales bacterium]|nr:MAG: DUF4476 domain-containing protein [Sphingobacteriales bacterium]